MRLYDFFDLSENMDHSQDGRAVPELKAALTAHRGEIQDATDDQVYDIIDRMMTRIAKSHGISGQKLHDMWVDKYGQIPDTWIMKIKEVAEAFDTPLPITWDKGDHGDIDALAKLPDGTNLSIMFNKLDNVKPDDKTWMVEFYRNNSQEVTGEGDAQKVFATVLTAIQQFIAKYKPLKIYFSASKEMDPSINYGPDDVVPNPESRAKLYDRMVLRYAKSWGYKFFRADNGSSVRYELSRLKSSVPK